MAVGSVQHACGVFAVAIPLLLIAGFYSQFVLDQLGERRDQLAMAVVAAVALIGEAAALTGVVHPNRLVEAVAALCTAVSGTGVLLVIVYLVRLHARRRAVHRRRRPRP